MHTKHSNLYWNAFVSCVLLIFLMFSLGFSSAGVGKPPGPPDVREATTKLDNREGHLIGGFGQILSPEYCQSCVHHIEEELVWQRGDDEVHVMKRVKCMEFLAAVVHDIFVRDNQLLSAMTIVYQHSQQVADARRSVELAVCASYCTGYHCFYNIGSLNMDQLVASQHPAHDYNLLAMGQFGVAFGDPQVGWINPTGLDFESDLPPLLFRRLHVCCSRTT